MLVARMPPVRTRFAPSPTGFLHVGSARTALFNWAFTRRSGGSLVLRIEDTDRERSTRESEAAVVDGLSWLGVDWDEGPFRQSERADRHAEAIETLLAKDRAYRCVCTPEELDARRQSARAEGRNWVYDGRCRDRGLPETCGPHSVRLRIPADADLGFEDVVFGETRREPAEIGDVILRRSDGAPLYNLAVVVDDRDMGITHVIRGADHRLNTPVQLAIYQALEAEPPVFAHLPLIVSESGKKLSKRRDPVAVQDYRDRGFLPQALRNWLVRLGWSHGDQELFDAGEICELFDLAAVHRASAQADPGKLAWLNQHYLKALPREELLRALHPFLEAEAGGPVAATSALADLVDLLRERSKTLADMAEGARFVLREEIAYEEKAAKKHLTAASEPVLQDLHDRLAQIDDWSEPALEAAFEAVRAAHGDLSMGKLAQPVRVAVTGTAASPGIFETLRVLGRERTVGRLAEALHYVRHG